MERKIIYYENQLYTFIRPDNNEKSYCSVVTTMSSVLNAVNLY
jgi:hypothetical protein